MIRPDQGVFLTRISNGVKKEDNMYQTNTPLVEFIPFNQIAWVLPYHGRHPSNTLILLNSFEFRCYVQSFDFIREKVCQFVGRNAKAGITSPPFYWVI